MPAKRNSGIDLVKVIAIFLIVISHCLPLYGGGDSPYFINLSIASNSIQHFLLTIFNHFGNIGNIIFIICSSYFLLESKRSKHYKIVGIYIDTMVWSMVYLAIFFVIGEVSLRTVISSFVSLCTLQPGYWFILAYILFYLLHPYLNMIIEKVNKRDHRRIIIFSFIVYGLLQFLGEIAFYSKLLSFIFIYFIVGYMKKYMSELMKDKKKNAIYFVVSLAVFVGVLLVLCFAGLNVHIGGLDISDNMLRLNTLGNPLIIILCLSLFNLLSCIEVESRLIRYLSSISLLIYLIHGNSLLKEKFVHFFKYIYDTFTYRYIALWSIVLAIIVFTASVLIATIYKFTVQRIVNVLSKKITEGIRIIETKLFHDF